MLHSLAIGAMKNAYVPYSKFRVVAAIKSIKGKFYVGCNVENAAFPQGFCAETGAIAAMVSGGCKLIDEILVVSESSKLIVPCGGCRQKLREFSTAETRVFLATKSKIEKTLLINDLLPFSFDRSFLT